ncbi:DNA replication factor c subunit [Viridothelium virens]|uniref:DNA replication factor c subunit n=1 Tax=Viridothelium virens TaxID=1048519 RepID=A0A6A6HAA7_VIRVR|nr:DNA replication factor c subunit [Viridothelium virens]
MASFFDIKARKAAAAEANSSKTPAKPLVDNRLQPWIEKYRPKYLADVTAQSHTTQILARTLQTTNLPHLLFYGPPGTGKTSTILALCHQLFGPLLFKSRVLELNASDERGIGIVRKKVKDFARQQLSQVPTGRDLEIEGKKMAYQDRYPCPPYKVIILDEADSMTQDAQSALRRTMETYSRLTRFCLVCNYVSRIIDPLASRCSKFRFKSLDSANASNRLQEIAQHEGVRVDSDAIEALIRCSEGDLRRAITFLQSAARLVGALAGTGPVVPTKGKRKKEREEEEEEEREAEGGGDKMDIDADEKLRGDTITASSIEEIAGVIPSPTIESLVSAMQSPKSPGTRFQAVERVVRDMVADGWSANQTVAQLYERVVFDETVSDRQKYKIVSIFSEVDKRLIDGADEWMEMLDLCLRISGILTER